VCRLARPALKIPIRAWQPEAHSHSCCSEHADPNARVCRPPAPDPRFAPGRTARSWAARGHKSARSSSRRSVESPRRESIRGVRRPAPQPPIAHAPGPEISFHFFLGDFRLTGFPAPSVWNRKSAPFPYVPETIQHFMRSD